MFSDAGPDVRWIGNERGVAGDTNWSTMDPDAVPYPGADGAGIIAALQNGDPDGTRVAPRRDRRVDPAGLVLSPGRRREGEDGGSARGPVLHVGGPELEAAAQRAADARGSAARDGRGTTRGNGGARLDTLTRLDLARGRALRAMTTTGDRSAMFELDLGRDSTIAIVGPARRISQHGQAVSTLPWSRARRMPRAGDWR